MPLKTITKTLFHKEFTSPIKYGYNSEHVVKTFIIIKMHFDFKLWLRFSVSVPNSSYCKRNIFKALIRALEHESIGMQKYEKMKSDVRSCGLYNRLDVK